MIDIVIVIVAAARMAVGKFGSAMALAAMFIGANASAAPGAAGCAALTAVTVPNTTIGSANYVTSPAGHYCEVAATVAPQHDVLVRLPDVWSRRYVQYGGGGFDGTIPNLSAGFGTTGRDPVANGFVVAASNGGHRASQFPGASFALDRGLTLSYSVAKIFDTDLVSKALMRAYYGEPARYRYFTGCSNGGKNASVAASNYFDHYDGIVGAAGVWGHADDHVGGADISGLTAKWAQTVQMGWLSPVKGAALRAKIVEACDALDGVRDGLVSDVAACPVRKVAQQMRCVAGDDGACLTSDDLHKVAVLTRNLVIDGKVTGPAWAGVSNLATLGAAIPLSAGFLSMAYRSAAPVDPATWDIAPGLLEVKTVLDDVYNMTGDLDGIRKYLARDKKLILFHGWEDTTVPPFGSINFFESLSEVDPQGARNVRLYMDPGVGHCGGGSGADSTDLLHVVARWVEQGAEPGSPANPALAWKVGSPSGPQDVSGASFSRPLCPYPSFPFYRGRGDSTLADSFACRPGPSAPR